MPPKPEADHTTNMTDAKETLEDVPTKIDFSMEDEASCLEVWTLGFMTPLLKLGAKQTLQVEDLGVVRNNNSSAIVEEKVRTAWNKELELYKKNMSINLDPNTEKKLKEPSLVRALVSAYGKRQLYLALFYYICSALIQFGPVLLLNEIVSYLEYGRETILPPYIEVALLFVLPLCSSLLLTHYQLIMNHFSTMVRTGVSLLVYEKTLNVGAGVRGSALISSGEIINLMSNDTTQIQKFLQFSGLTLVAPLQIALSIYGIWNLVGPAVFVGLGYMVFLFPLNGIIFANVSKLRRQVVSFADKRVKLVGEILGGIRILKFYAWEAPYLQQIAEIRGKELKALTKLAYVIAVGFSLLLMSAPIIQPVLVFWTYIETVGKDLTAGKAFTVIALFNVMRFPFAFLPMGLVQFIQARIALRRIGRYIHLPELEQYIEYDANLSADKTVAVFDKASFGWIPDDADGGIAQARKAEEEMKKKKNRRSRKSKKSSNENSADVNVEALDSSNSEVAEKTLEATPNLVDISLKLPQNQLIALVGPVGSGKSSFLQALLNEMTLYNGSVTVAQDTSISYCAQTPWIINATLRENILFGKPFVEGKYNEVLKRCALPEDIAQLPGGDQTEIGERGINLSGGQKARISLARALYQMDESSPENRLFLLDDVLSAVDAHVGEHLFENAIRGLIDDSAKSTSGSVTTALVTHHTHFLPRCDKVIIIDQGKITHFDSYANLIAQGVDFAGAIEMEEADDTAAKEEDKENKDENAETTGGKIEETKGPGGAGEGKEDKLMSKEERKEGTVDFTAYLHYAKLGGIISFTSIVIMQGVSRGFEILASFWLSYWAEEALASEGDYDAMYYIRVFTAISMSSVVCVSIRSICLAQHRLHASRKLHANLIESIMRAPVRFFDVTPIGRVLNRFSADMDKIDLELSPSLSQGLSTMASISGSIAAIIAATKGIFILPMLPLFAAYYFIQRWFRKTNVELQRLTSITASPIFVDFSETLIGTSTIRAYARGADFFDSCKKNFDINNISYMSVQNGNSWLGLRLDVLGGLIAVFVAGLALATKETKLIPAGWLALSLTFSNELSQYLKHGVRMISQLEAEMSSVERVLYYTNNVEHEAPSTTEYDPKQGCWPTKGAVEFSSISMRYRPETPLVLKGLSFSVKGGERIGVVGRTGSGKSSLMNALFRIVELENDGGFIKIDGIDISKLGTQTLRSKLSIIPQDPVMFSNTVRYNIDPFNQASDDKVWSILEKVQLRDVIARLPLGLEDQVAEGGENFSQGQRQLICIARALLREPKVLVMDEATASIDNATDALIQTMIRENFKDTTVLTIAHRLNTIMDSDRILVLDDGNMVEFDTPKKLMNIDGGIFKGLVDESRKSKGSRLNLAELDE